MLQMTSTPVPCPPGTLESVGCRAGAGSGEPSGLGEVTGTYIVHADMRAARCDEGLQLALGYEVVLTVAGAGESWVAVPAAEHRASTGTTLSLIQRYGFNDTGAAGNDYYWAGTITVPGPAG
jgi:hypothetical protein